MNIIYFYKLIFNYIDKLYIENELLLIFYSFIFKYFYNLLQIFYHKLYLFI